jgi:hypothetical protein
MHIWAWIQLLCTILIVFYFYGNLKPIGLPNIFVYGGFVFLTVYAYTELMDRNPFALVWEMVKNVIGLGLIYSMGDWFGINSIIPFGKYIVAAYFIISTIVTAALVFGDILQEAKVAEKWS